MEEYLKHYTLRITALSPIHVGDGTKLGKKEYIQQGMRNPILVPDTGKMFHDLQLLRRERAYGEFMLQERRLGLGQWLKDQGIPPQRIQSWKRYSMDAGDAFVRKQTGQADKPPKGIQCFMKDAYHQPYVPGSTLKGMLRTALLCRRILENPKKYEQTAKNLAWAIRNPGNCNTTLKNETQALEIAVFHNLNRNKKEKENAINSMMSGFIVSDSKPLSEGDLILARKIDYTLRGEEKTLPILREALKPETKIDFELTIDSRICDITIEEVLSALNYFQKISYEHFYRHFLRGRNAKGIVWLGGGTGFLSKTILFPLYGKQAVALTDRILRPTLGKKDDDSKHIKEVSHGISPHVCKCTRYRGKLYDMGMGKIEVLE